MSKNKYYLIESGVMLDAVKLHIDSLIKSREAASELAKSLGAEDIFCSQLDARVTGFGFKRGKQPDGWTKPKPNGFCRPKARSKDEKLIDELPRPTNDNKAVLEILGLHLCVTYKSEHGEGSSFIGNPFREAGFLYPAKDGPYAFWIPDVQHYIDDYISRGYTITNNIADWSMGLAGVREITKSEWELEVAKKKVEMEFAK